MGHIGKMSPCPAHLSDNPLRILLFPAYKIKSLLTVASKLLNPKNYCVRITLDQIPVVKE